MSDMSESQQIDVPASELTPAVRAALGRLTDDNQLLRASLAEMRRRLHELERLADTDSLTPLPGRRRFLAELERVVGQANRHGTPAALLSVDLKSLKKINDRHGHYAGDAALVHVARLLAGLIRASDLAARTGGDEFALILDHLDHDSAIETAERIEQCIAERPLELGGERIALDISVGVATILAGDTVEGVLHRADRNLSLAKADPEPRSFRVSAGR
jgi:diguanylate cyclase (GGDEF)-like protein